MQEFEIISKLYSLSIEETLTPKKRSYNVERSRPSSSTVEKLEKTLSDEGKQLLKLLLEQWSNFESETNEESFILGFRTGAQLMREILETDSTLS